MSFFSIRKSGLFITLCRPEAWGCQFIRIDVYSMKLQSGYAFAYFMYYSRLYETSIFPFSRFLQALSILHGRPASKSRGIFTRILRRTSAAETDSKLN